MQRKVFLGVSSGVALLASMYSISVANDYYHSWGELISDTTYTEGTDYLRRYYSKNGNDTIIHAIHGGEIERGTTELAEDIAGIHTGTYDYNLYIFEDIIDDSSSGGDDRIFHISAYEYEETILLSKTSQASKVVSLHGAGDTTALVYIGGLNDHLRNTIKTHLEAAAFTVDMNPPADLGGTHILNTTNLGRTQAGVQLEITNGLREQLFDDLKNASTRASSKTSKYWDFVNAIRAAIDEADAHPEGTTRAFDLDVFESGSSAYLFYDPADPWSPLQWLDGDEHFLFNQGSLLYYKTDANGNKSKFSLDDFRIRLENAHTGQRFEYDVTFDPNRFDGTHFRKATLDLVGKNIPSALYGITIINQGNGDSHPTLNGQSWLYGELVHP